MTANDGSLFSLAVRLAPLRSRLLDVSVVIVELVEILRSGNPLCENLVMGNASHALSRSCITVTNTGSVAIVDDGSRRADWKTFISKELEPGFRSSSIVAC